MTYVRRMAVACLVFVWLLALFPELLTSIPYEFQDRELLSQEPSREHPLGTDELGRDRFARLLHGARVSLLLAPAAALLSTAIGALAGIACGFLGGRFERGCLFVVDLVLSTPWLFLLLAVRALLPLNVPAWTSAGLTFALLGVLGWAPGVRVISAAAKRVSASEYLLQARAFGCSPWRLLLRQSLPNVRPVVVAQFWIALPIFVLAEANLSLLGLGVSEPLPSLGNLMAELQNYPAVMEQPWILAPAILLLGILAALQFALPKEI